LAMVNCRTKAAAAEAKFIDTKVVWVVGPTGCGKSAGARYQYPNIFNVMVPRPGGQLWFDGYEGENEILLDDFDGSIDFRLLLRMTDIYAMRVEIKGGRVERNWHVVIITSNKMPGTCYEKEDISPLLRRIKLVELPREKELWPLPADIEAIVEGRFQEDFVGTTQYALFGDEYQ